MDHLYRISQPSGLMGFSRHSRHGASEEDAYGEGMTRNRNNASERSDGRDFASVLARVMAR
jgi:hypothetical protein